MGAIDGLSISSTSSWTNFDSDFWQATVAGLAISVGVGLLLVEFPVIRDKASVYVSTFASIWLSGYFPSSYQLTCYKDDYVRVIDEYTTKWKYVFKVYGGTVADPKQDKADTVTIFQDHLS